MMPSITNRIQKYFSQNKIKKIPHKIGKQKILATRKRKIIKLMILSKKSINLL